MEFKQFVMPPEDDENEVEDGMQRVETPLIPHSTSSAPPHSQASPATPTAPESNTITFADDHDIEMQPMLGTPSTADSTASSGAPAHDADAARDKEGRLVREEERAMGNVGYQLYLDYFKSWGPCFILPSALCLAQLCNNALGVSHLINHCCAALAADDLGAQADPRAQICSTSVSPTYHAALEPHQA